MAPRYPIAATIVALLSLTSCPATGLLAEEGPLLRDGDRVVLLGGTFIERMQTHGYLETELTAVLRQRNLTFRNLGWSGDNVLGESRAVFGSVEDGYARLLRDLKLASPSVVLVHYGIVEARDGAAGMDSFRKGIDRLISDINQMDSRVIVLLPRPQRNMGPPFPSSSDFNASLARYRTSMLESARSHGAATVDLDAAGTTRLRSVPREGSGGRSRNRRTPFGQGLLADGMQLTAEGYWDQAPGLAAALGAIRHRPEFTIDLVTNRLEASGVTVKYDHSGSGDMVMTYQAMAIPRPESPRDGLQQGRKTGPLLAMIKGLPQGKYSLASSTAAWGPFVFSSRQLATGVTLPIPGEAELLRRTIEQKNEYFFHRYRPQNETYLFLFRKHEQGNNAVEVPMFDPLVESLDREIRRLSTPSIQTLRLQRQPTTNTK